MGDGHGDIAGYRLTGRTRIAELGSWSGAITPDGRRAGVLRFDPHVVGLPGVRERLIAAVVTDRQLAASGVAGLVPPADLAAVGDEVWLLTDRPVSPVLSELLTAGVVDAAGAAAVLVETARILMTLHTAESPQAPQTAPTPSEPPHAARGASDRAYGAGVTHGSLSAATVVVAEDGSVHLLERGLADAVHGVVSAPGQDVAAWARLAGELAASAPPHVAEMFERAAAAAVRHGLATARATLLGDHDRLPAGRISLDRLAMEARHRAAVESRHPAAGRPTENPGTRPTVPASGADRDEGEIVTVRRVPTAPPQRFGPGVATGPTDATTAAPTRGRGPGSGRRQGSGRGSGRNRARPVSVVALVVAVVVAGVVFAWARSGGSVPLTVTTLEVRTSETTVGCDSAVIVTGRVTTNGAPGEIVYEWSQSDRATRTRRTQQVTAGTTEYTLPLRWSVAGKSTVKLTATLTIVSPDRLEKRADFTYQC
ncbi:hypothetical protein [Nonomuraea longicatena]|uniref:Ig-like domain-containing protein n=1 Tax=Nonomuraea longicatena TaxID=83682 RepID=A0ABN1NSH1_9ACTN